MKYQTLFLGAAGAAICLVPPPRPRVYIHEVDQETTASQEAAASKREGKALTLQLQGALPATPR